MKSAFRSLKWGFLNLKCLFFKDFFFFNIILLNGVFWSFRYGKMLKHLNCQSKNYIKNVSDRRFSELMKTFCQYYAIKQGKTIFVLVLKSNKLLKVKNSCVRGEFNIWLPTKAVVYERVICNWFCTPIIFKTPIDTGFWIRNLLF